MGVHVASRRERMRDAAKIMEETGVVCVKMTRPGDRSAMSTVLHDNGIRYHSFTLSHQHVVYVSVRWLQVKIEERTVDLDV